MKKILTFMAVALMCLLIIGCGGGDKKGGSKSGCNEKTVTTDEPVEKPEPLSAPSSSALPSFSYLNDVAVTENIPVKVYVDGTASMAGYTNRNAPSIFKDVVKSIEPIFHARWKSNKIEFVRFGDAYVPFDGENFLKFEKEDFYKDIDTRLDNVIKDTDNQSLNIIITDLFQTNQHYTSLSNALETKCFGDQADRSFAIIGVKSQFKGKIYDVANHAPVEYNSEEGNVASYRPFYMLVVGKDSDVKVFSYEFLRKFSNAKISLYTNEYGHDSKLALGKDFGKTKKGFQNKGDKDGIIHIKAKLGDKVNDKLAFLAKRLPVSMPANYTVEITDLEKLTGGSINPLSKEKAAFTKAENKGLVTGTAGFDANSADITSDVMLTVDAKKDNEGKYKVTLGMFATRENYVKGQDAFKEWNFDENKVPAADAEIGTKTQSISAFTQLVADKHYMQDKPGLRNIVFYLDVE